MFVSRDREKLLNAIIYFLRETKHCHTLKLFKLLNFADFEHFRQKGRTITGLEYRAPCETQFRLSSLMNSRERFPELKGCHRTIRSEG